MITLLSLQETSKLFFALEHLRCINCAALQHGMSSAQKSNSLYCNVTCENLVIHQHNSSLIFCYAVITCLVDEVSI